MKKIIKIFCFCLFLYSDICLAGDDVDWPEDLPAGYDPDSEFRIREPDRPRNYLWPPLVSLFLPGFDQWLEGQDYAPAYTIGASLSLFYAFENVPGARTKNESLNAYQHRKIHGVKERKFTLGMQTYQVLGGFSAYHSFRGAARSRIQQGEFSFLTKEESMSDLLKAPFRFDFLGRMSTWLPLSIISAYYVASVHFGEKIDDSIRRDSLTGSDVFFAGAISYNAGTHEEAVFRGWLMPVFREWTGSGFWANASQSALFAAAHLSATNQLPLPQLLLGWHLGRVSQNNDWTISESIFIHAWWDVVAFLAIYQVKITEKDSNSVLPSLSLPVLDWRF